MVALAAAHPSEADFVRLVAELVSEVSDLIHSRPVSRRFTRLSMVDRYPPFDNIQFWYKYGSELVAAMRGSQLLFLSWGAFAYTARPVPSPLQVDKGTSTALFFVRRASVPRVTTPPRLFRQRVSFDYPKCRSPVSIFSFLCAGRRNVGPQRILKRVFQCVLYLGAGRRRRHPQQVLRLHEVCRSCRHPQELRQGQGSCYRGPPDHESGRRWCRWQGGRTTTVLG